jgi:hypothetical protein
MNFLIYIHIKVIFRLEEKVTLITSMVSREHCSYLDFLRHNSWRKKTTQVVCIPLLLRESKTLVVLWIPQKGVTTVAE